MRFNQTDMLYKENGKKNIGKWMRKNLLISSTHVFVTWIIEDMKLGKFQVESVFCHLQGGNYEFKIAL